MANQDAIYDFLTNVVLDVEVSNQTAAESFAISEGLSDLQSFAIARAEAFRQMRARNVFAFDVPTIALDADPVQALTLMERAVLSLTLRQKFSEEEVCEILDDTRKIIRRDLKEGRKNLARAAIALTLMANPTKCPVVNAAHQTLGSRLTRAQQLHLVTHAAECSICVKVLRLVDKQVIQDFIDAPMLKYPNNLPEISAEEKARLLKRADLQDGWPMKVGRYFENPRISLRNATVFGAASSVLIALGLYLLNQ